MNVVELCLALPKMQISIQLRDGLAVGRGICHMDLALAAGIRFCARRLQRKIGFAGEGVVVSEKRLERGNIRLVQVEMQSKRADICELAVLQERRKIEVSTFIPASRGTTL